MLLVQALDGRAAQQEDRARLQLLTREVEQFQESAAMADLESARSGSETAPSLLEEEAAVAMGLRLELAEAVAGRAAAAREAVAAEQASGTL